MGPDPTVCALIRAPGLVLINKTFGPGLKKLAQVQKEETVRPCSSASQTAVGEPGAPAYSCHPNKDSCYILPSAWQDPKSHMTWGLLW